MEVILIKAGQLILSLSILIILHELGHFLPAKWFGIKVEKFYLFFDPWFSLVKKKIGDTTYGIGWLPLGGYVKISGMIDESMDKEQMAKAPEPWEFRSKPAWQRLIVMVGGVTVNVLLAILIYAMILSNWGSNHLSNDELKYGVTPSAIVQDEIGILPGDKVVKLDNNEVTDFFDLRTDLIIDAPESITVERNGEFIELPVSMRSLGRIIKSKQAVVEPRIPFEVAEVFPDGQAVEMGFEVGDKILAINGIETPYFDQFKTEITSLNEGDAIAVTVDRNGSPTVLSGSIPKDKLLGIAPVADYKEFFNIEHRDYGFFKAIPAGIAMAIDKLELFVKQFKFVFSKEAKGYKEVGGFLAIGKIFPAQWNWLSFWSLTAFLSIMLAFLNILPIPALDGGHVMFLLWEVVTGRKPSEKLLERSQVVGMLLLLTLFVLVNGNDVYKLITGAG